MSPKGDTLPNVKQQIIQAAIQLFADKGYYKTTTANIANAVGVTQPYVFHFFSNKEQLYLAVLEQAIQRVFQTFLNVEAPSDKLKEAMSQAFNELLNSHRNEILVTMMAYTIPETEIRDVVRKGFDQVYEQLKMKFLQAGYPDASREAKIFIGEGLLISLSETIQLEKLLPWYP
ncbi:MULTISPECIES: TetR/AcrR family transcriptional regulator [Paenibacillus]|uniref:TetR/AcrR family transcriptional regulator n=1 Tax=Paenibacillus TaxID=44249 RepID=UPI00048EA619|nr:TetR/AcrR family transcriptional regulator [Paenibacillus sp. IHBB 10380]